MSNSFPVIRLQLEGLRHTVLHAFSEEQLKMDEMLKQELDRYLSDASLRMVLRNEVEANINLAVKESVHHWFVMSPDGQKLIKDRVAAELDERAKYMAAGL